MQDRGAPASRRRQLFLFAATALAATSLAATTYAPLAEGGPTSAAADPSVTPASAPGASFLTLTEPVVPVGPRGNEPKPFLLSAPTQPEPGLAGPRPSRAGFTLPEDETPTPAADLLVLEQHLFDAQNAERVGRGLTSLIAEPLLARVARDRAYDMAIRGYFAHTSPTGETAFNLLDRYGYDCGRAAENLARNNYPDDHSAAVAMSAFLASAAHRANLLNPVYTRVGVGVAVDASGMKYFAVVFAAR